MRCCRIAFITVFLFVMSFTGTVFAVDNGGYANPKAVVSPAQLEKMMADNAVKVIDARTSMEYLFGHITGAVNIDVFSMDIEKNGVPFVFPDAKKFAELMGANGITNDDFVVIYSDTGTPHAARIAWGFMQFGHSKAALLDGYWNAIKDGTSYIAPSVTPSNFAVKDGGKLVASIDDVKASLGKAEFVILDARSPGEYTGKVVIPGSGKEGRIPGAINIYWSENLDENELIKDAAELKKMYEAKGVTPDKTVIVYCFIGYRASFSAYVLKELLGYPNVILYDGSWLEWSNADVPVEK